MKESSRAKNDLALLGTTKKDSLVVFLDPNVFHLFPLLSFRLHSTLNLNRPRHSLFIPVIFSLSSDYG